MGKIIRIINGKIVRDTDHAKVNIPSETAARQRREIMKTNNRKAMLQRTQVDYYKAYPEQAKNLSPELRRLLS